MNNYNILNGISLILLLLTGFGIFIVFIFSAISFISLFKIFKKANNPGWAAFIPIYNIIVLLQITNIPVWAIFILIIPSINVIGGLILHILISMQLAKTFKKEDIFVIGLILMPIIFYPILAFDKSEYSEVKPIF